MTFDAYNRELKWASRQVERWADYKLPPHWLTFLGPSGVGKTHLAKMALRLVGRSGQLWPWTTILDNLRGGEWAFKDHLKEAPVIAIDDLGAGHDTAFSQALADEFADARLGKRTIWTSNLTLAQIGDQISQRVRSRMMRGENVVQEILDTPDYSNRSKP